YKLNTDDSLFDIASLLKEDSRVDFTAWSEKGWVHVLQGGKHEREFRYKPKGVLKDVYGQLWTVEGDSEVLDVSMNQSLKTIEYGDYPDALRRLYGALHSHKGEFLIVTAKEGYELGAAGYT